MSVNAMLFEHENEPEFFRRKCRCGEIESECICADELRDRERDEAQSSSHQ
jgi:hypothetical protein